MQSYDIAIVGLGPVGSAAAILLAHAGLKVVAFERDKDIYALPRAVGMDGEIVRGFQRIGHGEALARLLQPIREGDRAGFANSKRAWLFGHELKDFGQNGWPPMSMFDQPEVDGYLRSAALNHPNVTAFVGAQVERFEDLADQVIVHARTLDNEAEHRISAHYLLGCDGAASSIRRALDIDWQDLGYDHDWLVVDVIVKEGHRLNLDTVQVCDPDRLATYVATKDPFRRWEFKLNPGETREQMLDPETIHRLIELWTPRDTYTLRRSAVYQFHAATADRWRVGRVLLAGDAAHQTPPFLGQGMNAGMRDVINLAWKLPLILSGVADATLLDAYQAERGAHAQDLVEWAVTFGKLMEHLAAVEAAQRAGLTPPETPENARSSGYGQGRESPPLREGVIMIDQVSNDGSTGYLFRQPVVRDAGNRVCLLDEHLGEGFAVVARSAADLKLNPESRALVDRLGITVTTIEGLAIERGGFDRLFKTVSAAIVRPDRYVFGHTTDSINLDALLAQLKQKLCIAQ